MFFVVVVFVVVFLRGSQENGPLTGKGQEDRKATGLGRRTREGIGKWNQTTALRFQTEGGGERERHKT